MSSLVKEQIVELDLLGVENVFGGTAGPALGAGPAVQAFLLGCPSSEA